VGGRNQKLQRRGEMCGGYSGGFCCWTMTVLRGRSWSVGGCLW